MIEPALLGAGVEHGVDLALADDHVLLAPDPGVGEQLLDVEEAARHVVDRVLAVAAAEQRAADRDLAELDRQQPGGVVDREADLGPAERGRDAVPAKITSSIFWLRTALGAWAPSTQAIASTTFDLPEPLGPTTTVTPGSSSSVVASANDLKPLRVRLFRNTASATLPGPQARIQGCSAECFVPSRVPATSDLPRALGRRSSASWQTGHQYVDRPFTRARRMIPRPHVVQRSPARP